MGLSPAARRSPRRYYPGVVDEWGDGSTLVAGLPRPPPFFCGREVDVFCVIYVSWRPCPWDERPTPLHAHPC